MKKTPASKTPHRVVRISLLLIIFNIFSSSSIASMQEKRSIAKMVESSDLIVRGKVISTESQWKEDSRGRHIYTTVTIQILDEIKGKTKGKTKGKIKGGVFAFEVVGGTVDDIREAVSDTPAFEVDEDAIVFLGGDPLAIQGGINGKFPIYDGKVYWDGSEATVDNFIQALKILKRDPDAKVSLGEESKAPTGGVTGGECFIYNGLRWFGISPVVDYKINRNTSDCLREGAAVRSAAETWNNACDVVNFRFSYDGSHSSTTSSRNGVNEIMWNEIWSGPSSVLARAWVWWIGETGEILECDVVFNDNFSWSTSPSWGEFDIESVALHEFGHWLLLGDLYDPADSDNIMYGYTSSGTEQRLLRQCDIDGLCYIYGCAGYCGGGNPVGWWRFDDFDTPLTAENSGSFGSSHNGTLDNMTPSDWVSGVRGTALELDGEDDYVRIPALNLDSDTVTISAWIKRNGDQAGSDTGIVFSRDGSTVAGLCFGHDEGWNANHHLGYNWNDDQAAWDWDSGLFVPDNQWVFISLVVESTKATLYLGKDGTLSSAANPINHAMEEFDGFTFIGSDGLWDGRFFKGSIDDVRIYDGALSAEEILQLYREGFGVRRASNPDPADGATRIATDAVLSWDAGTDAVSHDVYIGTNYNDVEHATTTVPLGVYQGSQPSTSYTPTLTEDTTYYWRIDEVEGLNTWRGDIWRFKTWVEPNLVSWWRFDEGQGYIAYDSASDNDGTVYGAQWTGGQIGGALEFDGVNDYVETADSPELDITDGITIGMWIKSYPGMDCDGRGNWRYLLRKGEVGWGAYNLIYEASWDMPKIGFTVVSGSDYRLWTNRAAYPGEFTYLAFTYDAETGEQKTYFNGDLDSQQITGGGFIRNRSGPLRIGGGVNTGCPDGAGFFKGLIDEVRIYDRALSAEEILQIYREGFRASNPNPADGATGIATDAVLSWDAGIDAVSHDVYFGTNYNDVVHATTTTALGVYQGSQSSTSYIPTLANDTTYYWRIDEVEGLNTWRGDVWRFKTWVEPNLVSWWRFDEGQGYTAYDSAGSNNGSVYGAQWTGGQIDGALEFDGEDDYIEVADSPGLDITDGITIGMWIKPYPGMDCDERGNWRYLLRKGEVGWGAYNLIYEASWDVPSTGFTVVTGSAYRLWTNSAAYPGEFTYLAFTYDAETGEQKTYFNGDLDSQQITGGGFIRNRSGPLRIGGGVNTGCPDGAGFFKGLIDEVRIYDRALSAEEILQLASFNTSPIACVVGGDRVVEADSDCEARVVLDGSCSSDADSTAGTNDDINDFDWYEVIDACEPNSDIYLGSGEVIECNLGLGEHLIVLEVTDKAGAFDSNEVVITVEDVTPPEFSLFVEPSVLWPPNHRMVRIEVSWEVSDNCDEQVQVSLVGVTSSEKDDGRGDGRTKNDIIIGDDGSIYLRAERTGSSAGRVYTITYEAVDDSGNASVGSAEVLVPDGYRWRHRERIRPKTIDTRPKTLETRRKKSL